MKSNKTLSLLTLAAMSVAVVGCGQSTNNVDLSSDLNSSDVSSFAAPSGLGNNGDVIPGEFIVKYKKTAKNATNSVLNSVGGTKVKDIQNTGMQVIKVDTMRAAGGDDVLTTLKKNPSVEWAEPNRIIKVPQIIKDLWSKLTGKTDSFPNDPMFKDQYSHKVTQAQDGWKILETATKADITVAVVDTGVDRTHPDLKAKMIEGYSAYPGQDAGVDKQGHGTHCAGIAAAITNNAVGVAGVASTAPIKIQPVKVLNDSGSGTYAAVADGIAWAASHGAKVISMSLGGPSSSQAITDAVNLALKNDIVVVAAMGNSGNSQVSYPAGIKGVMAVGATDSSDKIASFSQYGPHISVSAPGVKILSTFPMYASGMPSKEYGSISGTSMACPYVSGLAALVRAVNPGLKAADVRTRIEKSTDDLGPSGFDDKYGFGRVNVAKALQASLVARR